VSLPPNSIDTWDRLEQRFNDYFYNGETELRLSHLVAIRQKNNEVVCDYMRQLRDTRNKCYILTIGEKDLADLSFAGLSMALKDKMEESDFLDINQVMQRAMVHENWAKEHRDYNQFKEMGTRDKP
jgi:hypothetical protein